MTTHNETKGERDAYSTKHKHQNNISEVRIISTRNGSPYLRVAATWAQEMLFLTSGLRRTPSITSINTWSKTVRPLLLHGSFTPQFFSTLCSVRNSGFAFLLPSQRRLPTIKMIHEKNEDEKLDFLPQSLEKYLWNRRNVSSSIFVSSMNCLELEYSVVISNFGGIKSSRCQADGKESNTGLMYVNTAATGAPYGFQSPDKK